MQGCGAGTVVEMWLVEDVWKREGVAWPGLHCGAMEEDRKRSSELLVCPGEE